MGAVGDPVGSAASAVDGIGWIVLDCRPFQDGDGALGVLRTHLQAHPADKRRVHPGHIGVGQKTLDPRGIQAAFCHQRIGKTAELANSNEFRTWDAAHATIIYAPRLKIAGPRYN